MKNTGLLRFSSYVPRRQPFARSRPSRRRLHVSPSCPAIRTQKLGDVGEGITECMLNMWFVEEGARVEEWDKLCEMQSDKAAVDISVNYSGVIKKLYAEANDMIKTGTPLADIDDGLSEEEASAAQTNDEHYEEHKPHSAMDEQVEQAKTEGEMVEEGKVPHSVVSGMNMQEQKPSERLSLATPAVRGLLKEHNIDISKVSGSGKDGRILKEDVQNYLENRNATPSLPRPGYHGASVNSDEPQTKHPLSRIQTQMFRAMTASLAIPHFLYTDEVNVTRLSRLRRRLNQSREPPDHRLTLLPFILKAVSIALNQYPLLNARIDTATDISMPQLIYRSNHNIGIAMDTPAGLLVPVVKNVGALSITDIAHEIQRLSELGKTKKLSSADLSGGTITVSNIGSIGGTVVAPVIVEGQVAILGVGKARTIPLFSESGSIERAEIINFSWSADHRVVDGATMARMGSTIKNFIEEPEKLMVEMR